MLGPIQPEILNVSWNMSYSLREPLTVYEVIFMNRPERFSLNRSVPGQAIEFHTKYIQDKQCIIHAIHCSQFFTLKIYSLGNFYKT